jgi:hypothetical protein
MGDDAVSYLLPVHGRELNGQRGPWQLHVPAKLNADGTYPKDTHESSPSSLYDKHKPQVLFGSWWGCYLERGQCHSEVPTLVTHQYGDAACACLAAAQRWPARSPQ